MITDFLYESLPTFIWSLTVFVIFVLILLKVAIKPVVAALDARETKIRDELKASEQALADAQAQQEKLQAELAEAEQTVAKLIAEGRASAEAQSAQILEDGRNEASRQLERAKRDIDTAKQQALTELRAGIAEIATMAAGRIIHKELDVDAQQQLVADTIDSLRESAS